MRKIGVKIKKDNQDRNNLIEKVEQGISQTTIKYIVNKNKQESDSSGTTRYVQQKIKKEYKLPYDDQCLVCKKWMLKKIQANIQNYHELSDNELNIIITNNKSQIDKTKKYWNNVINTVIKDAIVDDQLNRKLIIIDIEKILREPRYCKECNKLPLFQKTVIRKLYDIKQILDLSLNKIGIPIEDGIPTSLLDIEWSLLGRCLYKEKTPKEKEARNKDIDNAKKLIENLDKIKI